MSNGLRERGMRKALIFWGGWEGHEPQHCAEIIAKMLDREGFGVRMEKGTAALADPSINDVNLIVPVYTMSKIAREELLSLTNAVKGGVGLAGHHSGLGDAFRDEVEYHYMCGGQWVAHPGNMIDFRIDISKPDDPIVKGIESFPYYSQQFYMHVDPANEVLATTTFSGEHDWWTEGVVMPVVWKRRHGKGRVFYSSLGHSAKEFEVPEMRTIFHRGMLWAAAGKEGGWMSSLFIKLLRETRLPIW